MKKRLKTKPKKFYIIENNKENMIRKKKEK